MKFKHLMVSLGLLFLAAPAFGQATDGDAVGNENSRAGQVSYFLCGSHSVDATCSEFDVATKTSISGFNGSPKTFLVSVETLTCSVDPTVTVRGKIISGGATTVYTNLPDGGGQNFVHVLFPPAPYLDAVIAGGTGCSVINILLTLFF